MKEILEASRSIKKSHNSKIFMVFAFLGTLAPPSLDESRHALGETWADRYFFQNLEFPLSISKRLLNEVPPKLKKATYDFIIGCQCTASSSTIIEKRASPTMKLDLSAKWMQNDQKFNIFIHGTTDGLESRGNMRRRNQHYIFRNLFADKPMPRR